MSDDARFLADSPDRLALLERLREGVASPAVLAEDLDCVRRSVQRNLAAFAERDWVERGDGGYRLTTVGHLVARTHGDYLDRLERLDSYAPLLRHLDPKHAPEPELLEDAELVVATEADPQAPIHAYTERLRSFGGGRLRTCSPVLSRPFHQAHASLALRGTHTELLLSTATARRARELNPMEFEAVLRSGALDLDTIPEPVPFGLAVDGEALLLGAYDEDGHLEACLHGTDPELVAWGEAQFETLHEGAQRVCSATELGEETE
jgi:predicted transcriptional regulator